MPSILLVEDEPLLADVLALVLTEAGYAVHVALDGSTALEVLNRGDADAVVCDLHLPDQLGSAMCGAIRTQPRARSIPLILISAAGRGDLTMLAEGDAFLEQPFPMTRLLTLLQAQVGGASAG